MARRKRGEDAAASQAVVEEKPKRRARQPKVGEALGPGVAVARNPDLPPDSPGAPQVRIDETQLYAAALTHASYEHLAKIFGVSSNFLQMVYKDLIEKARAEQCRNLLAAQFDNAINKNNALMQIWLGKQYLGQQDKVVQVDEPAVDAEGRVIPRETNHTHRVVAYIPDNGRDGHVLGRPKGLKDIAEVEG